MRNYVLSFFALVLALCFSAFSSIKPKSHFTNLYWFKISNQHMPGTSVPPADALFIQQSTNPPTDLSCTGSTYDCIAGFDQSKVNTSTHQLNGSQTPDNVASTKPN